MRSVLIELGPWSWTAIPIIWVAVMAFVFLWHRLESGESGERLRGVELLGSAAISLLVALLLFYLVNRFAPLSIKAYGVMMLVAFTAGTTWTVYSAREGDIRGAGVIDVALGALIGGIVGSRVVYVLLNLEQFSSISDMLDVWSGGLSFHGGVAGAVIVVYIYCRHHGYGFPRVADHLAPGIALGYSFARIGCFLNGCCHGVPTDLPWGAVFPANSACSTPGIPVHPTQLYASALSLVIFAILVCLRPRMRRFGHLFLTYLMLYSVMRFAMEFSRAGATADVLAQGFFMTRAQLASILIFLACGVLIATTRPRKSPDE